MVFMPGFFILTENNSVLTQFILESHSLYLICASKVQSKQVFQMYASITYFIKFIGCLTMSRRPLLFLKGVVALNF